MSETKIRIEARAAAKWWRQKIASNFVSDNGEPMHGAMAAMIPKDQLTPSQLGAFQTILELLFDRIIDKYPAMFANGGVNTGTVDYGPDETLSEAYRDAVGKDPGLESFPWKTCLLACEGAIKVKCGYGSGWETINAAEFVEVKE